MKRGVSIIDPTSDDLARYELSCEIGSGEKPLWLGSPDMRYVFTLASSTYLLVIMFVAACFIIKLGIQLELDGDAYALRGVVVFSCIFAFIMIFDIAFILTLRRVIYLMSDKYIYIFIRDVRYTILYRLIGEACVDGRNRVLKYKLSQLSYYRAYSSVINKNVGNIFLSPHSAYFPNNNDDIVCVERQKVLCSSVTRIYDAIYAVRNFSQLCDIIKNGTIAARKLNK